MAIPLSCTTYPWHHRTPFQNPLVPNVHQLTFAPQCLDLQEPTPWHRKSDPFILHYLISQGFSHLPQSSQPTTKPRLATLPCNLQDNLKIVSLFFVGQRPSSRPLKRRPPSHIQKVLRLALPNSLFI